MQEENTTTVITEKTRFSAPITNILAWAISTLLILGSIIKLTISVTVAFSDIQRDVLNIKDKQNSFDERLKRLEDKK